MKKFKVVTFLGDVIRNVEAESEGEAEQLVNELIEFNEMDDYVVSVEEEADE